MTRNGYQNKETRLKLLEAAAHIFAEYGYRHATIREICKQAGVNIAAINYHFRDKESLYAEVIDFSLGVTQEPSFPSDNDPTLPVEERLRKFIHSFMNFILGEGRPTHVLKLMAKEMIEPTPALNIMIEKASRPISGMIRKIVADYLELPVDDLVVIDCGGSIIAQIIIYHNSRPVIARLTPHKEYDAETIQHLADHITNFSLGALDRIRAQKMTCPASLY